MKVLYMSHRYHTNQNTIMKGWKEHGDEVCFLSQYAGKIEDYTYVKPIVVGYSPLFMPLYKLYVNVLAKNNPAAMDIRLKIGVPPILKLRKIIREFEPEPSFYGFSVPHISLLREFVSARFPYIVFLPEPVGVP